MDPTQRGHRTEAIRAETKVILREPMGWCAVIGGRMFPLEDFKWGPLCKPRILPLGGLGVDDAKHTYCSMRGDGLSNDPLSWEATTTLMKMGRRTLHCIIDMVFKMTPE